MGNLKGLRFECFCKCFGKCSAGLDGVGCAALFHLHGVADDGEFQLLCHAVDGLGGGTCPCERPEARKHFAPYASQRERLKQGVDAGEDRAVVGWRCDDKPFVFVDVADDKRLVGIRNVVDTDVSDSFFREHAGECLDHFFGVPIH